MLNIKIFIIILFLIASCKSKESNVSSDAQMQKRLKDSGLLLPGDILPKENIDSNGISEQAKNEITGQNIDGTKVSLPNSTKNNLKQKAEKLTDNSKSLSEIKLNLAAKPKCVELIDGAAGEAGEDCEGDGQVLPPGGGGGGGDDPCKENCVTACATATAAAFAYAQAEASAVACAYAEAWACAFNYFWPFNKVCVWAKSQACAFAFAKAFAFAWAYDSNTVCASTCAGKAGANAQPKAVAK